MQFERGEDSLRSSRRSRDRPGSRSPRHEAIGERRRQLDIEIDKRSRGQIVEGDVEVEDEAGGRRRMGHGEPVDDHCRSLVDRLHIQQWKLGACKFEAVVV